VIEVGQRSVHGVDVFVIGNVVAEIYLRRRIAGSDPDRVHPQVVKVTHLRGDAVQIADPVVVAVGKTAGIDFIENGVLPPLVALRINRLRLCGSKIREGQRHQQNHNRKQSPGNRPAH